MNGCILNNKLVISFLRKALILCIFLSGIVFGQTSLEFFTPVANTGVTRPVKVMVATINGDTLSSGDEIAVFDDTLCVGACKVDTFPLAFASILEVRTPYDTLPGAVEGHSMKFRVWHKNTESELDGIPVYSRGGNFGDPLTEIDSIYAHIAEVTFTTNPAGLSYYVNGVKYTGEKKLYCNVDSTYELTADRYQDESNGSRYRFDYWSDGSDTSIVHIYTGPSSDETVTAHFYSQKYLTITSMYGSPTGEGWYDFGTNVNFKVDSTVAGGSGIRYVFTGWTGTGSGSYTGTDTSHTVTMNNPITEEASWKTQYTLTTYEDPDEGGDITLFPIGDPPGDKWYDSDSLVTVTTDTADNYLFTGWSGDLTGSSNPQIVTMDRPKSLTANYVRTVQCSVRTVPPGLEFVVDGNLYTETQVFTWIENSAHTLSVDSPQFMDTTVTRYVYSSWSDGGDRSHVYAVSTLEDTVTLEANFITQHLLTLFSAHGIVKGAGWCNQGADTTFSVSPDTVFGGLGIKYTFAGWIGTGTSSYTGPDTSQTLTMNSPVTEVADWDTLYYLTTYENTDAGGDITPSPPGEWYEIGTSVPLDTISMVDGYRWCGWSGDVTGKTVPDTIVMTGPKSVTANFGKEVQVTIQANPANQLFAFEDDTLNTPQTYTWIADSSYSISAVDSMESDTTTRYIFSSWSDGGAKNHDYLVPDSDDPVEVTVNYTIQHYLNLVTDHGDPSGKGWHDEGDEVIFYVDSISSGTTGIRYTFEEWTGTGTGSYSGTDSLHSVTMNNPIKEQASWTTQYKLTVNSDHGETWGQGWYDESTEVDFGVDSTELVGPGVRFTFDGWTGTGTNSYTGKDTSHTVSMINPITENASWKIQYFLTTVEIPPQGGDIVPPPPGAWYDSNSYAEIDTVGVEDDYSWNGWSGSIGGLVCPESIYMNGPKTVEALFGETTVCVITTYPVGLQMRIDGEYYTETQIFRWLQGSNHNLSVQDMIEDNDTRYYFNSWSDGGFRSHSYTVPATVDTDTVTVYFDTKYKLTVNTDHSTASGTGWYSEGQNANFRVLDERIDNNGTQYQFNKWEGTGNNSYTGEEISYYVTMNNPITETAIWDTLYQLTTTKNIDTAGTILRKPNIEWLDKGIEDTLTAVPSTDGAYVFDNWIGDIGSNDPSSTTIRIVMDGAKNIQANFAGVYHTLTTDIQPENKRGSIVVTPTKSQYLHTRKITVEAVANSGYVFSRWEGAVTGTSRISEFTILSDVTVTAYFGFHDSSPPEVTDCYPPKNAQMVAVNTDLEFKVVDNAYGVNLATLDVSVAGTKIVNNGQDQTGGLVTLNPVDKGYRIVYSPSADFSASTTVSVNVKSSDTAKNPNSMNYTYEFTTGTSSIENQTTGTFIPSSARVIVHDSGVTVTIPANALPDTTDITIAVLDNPPALPDTINGVGLTFYLGPAGLQFDLPVTISLPVNSSILEDAGVFSINDLKIFWFSTVTGLWEEIEVVSVSESEVIIKVNHFSYFTLATWKEALTVKGFAEIYNYPNPFDPDDPDPLTSSTVIRYELSKDAEVSIKIYDVSGCLVYTIEENKQCYKSIEYQSSWDGINDQGEIVANNVYFCVIESSTGDREVRKIAVLR